MTDLRGAWVIQPLGLLIQCVRNMRFVDETMAG